jgi:hypothetical protein
MKRLIIILLLFAATKVAGQTIGYLRFDTVMITKVGGTAELVLLNKTKDTVGILANPNGNGRTRFMRSRAINDSTIVVGPDTLVLKGYNTNTGTGYRWATDGSNEIKTFTPSFGLLLDSTINSGSITGQVDSFSVLTRGYGQYKIDSLAGEVSTTASNGLTKTNNDIALGGTLSGNTDIDLNSFNLGISGTGAFTFPNGSAASPILKFSGHTSGIYSGGNNNVSIAANGERVASFGTTSLTLGRWENGGTFNLSAPSASGGSNRDGVNLVISSGTSTNSGIAGNMIFRVGVSGSMLPVNPLINAMAIKSGTGRVVIGGLVEPDDATHQLTVIGDMSVSQTPTGTNTDSVIVKGSDNKFYAVAQSDISGGGGGGSVTADYGLENVNSTTLKVDTLRIVDWKRLYKVVDSLVALGGGGGGMSIGGTVTSGTAGSVLFVASGPVLAQDNSNFYWDNSNKRLGINDNTPSHALDVTGTIGVNGYRFAYYPTGISDASTTLGIGEGALASHTSGQRNVAIGFNALNAITTGFDNVAIGSRALDVLGTSANTNVAIGKDAGGGLTSGNGNVFLGSSAATAATSGSGNIAIGSSAALPSNTGSNQLNIGNSFYSNTLGGSSIGLAFGGLTSSKVMLKQSSTIFQVRLGDDSDYSDLEVKDDAYGSGWNGSNAVPTKNAIYDKIESLGSGSSPYIYQFISTQQVTVSNTATETTIYGTGEGSAGIDGSSNITTGTQIVLKGAGTIDTDGVSAGTPTLSFTLGSSTVSIPISGLANGLNDSPYSYEYKAIPLGTGTSQSYIWFMDIYVENNTTPLLIKLTGRETSALTTTGTVTASVTVEWDVADSDNTWVANYSTIELFKK